MKKMIVFDVNETLLDLRVYISLGSGTVFGIM